MKKLLLFIILFFGICYTGSAQNMELKVTKDSTLVQGSYSYSVNLTITGKKAPYNINLYTDWMSDHSKTIASRSNCNESNLRFENLPSKTILYISVISIAERKGVVSTIQL